MKKFPHGRVVGCNIALPVGQTVPAPAYVVDSFGRNQPGAAAFVVREATFEDYIAQVVEDGSLTEAERLRPLETQMANDGYRFYEMLFD